MECPHCKGKNIIFIRTIEEWYDGDETKLRLPPGLYNITLSSFNQITGPPQVNWSVIVQLNDTTLVYPAAWPSGAILGGKQFFYLTEETLLELYGTRNDDTSASIGLSFTLQAF